MKNGWYYKSSVVRNALEEVKRTRSPNEAELNLGLMIGTISQWVDSIYGMTVSDWLLSMDIEPKNYRGRNLSTEKRKQVAEYALKYGVKSAAIEFNVSQTTVYDSFRKHFKISLREYKKSIPSQ
jgi:hypothetical protein